MRVRSEPTALTRPFDKLKATLSRSLGRGLFALLLLLSACTTAREVTPLWAGLTPGKYAVGFRDNTWYPAAAGGELLRFRDYVPFLEDVDALLHGYRVSDAAIVELFDMRMYALRDAPALAGSFPAVQISLGIRQTIADHAVLGEFIASHGYVVTIEPRGELTIAPAVTTMEFAASAVPEIGTTMKHRHSRRYLATAGRQILRVIAAGTSRRPT